MWVGFVGGLASFLQNMSFKTEDLYDEERIFSFFNKLIRDLAGYFAACIVNMAYEIWETGIGWRR